VDPIPLIRDTPTRRRTAPNRRGPKKNQTALFWDETTHKVIKTKIKKVSAAPGIKKKLLTLDLLNGTLTQRGYPDVRSNIKVLSLNPTTAASQSRVFHDRCRRMYGLAPTQDSSSSSGSSVKSKGTKLDCCVCMSELTCVHPATTMVQDAVVIQKKGLICCGKTRHFLCVQCLIPLIRNNAFASETNDAKLISQGKMACPGCSADNTVKHKVCWGTQRIARVLPDNDEGFEMFLTAGRNRIEMEVRQGIEDEGGVKEAFIMQKMAAQMTPKQYALVRKMMTMQQRKVAKLTQDLEQRDEQLRAGGGKGEADPTPLLKEVSAAVLSIQAMMTRNCPGCSVPIQGTRGDCSAYHCSQCQVYFCWYCNVTVPGGSTPCHNHVRECPRNPRPGHYFSRNVHELRASTRYIVTKKVYEHVKQNVSLEAIRIILDEHAYIFTVPDWMHADNIKKMGDDVVSGFPELELQLELLTKGDGDREFVDYYVDRIAHARQEQQQRQQQQQQNHQVMQEARNARAVAPIPAGPWVCQRCTFENPGMRPRCGVCGFQHGVAEEHQLFRVGGGVVG
jgi:hypothetical protein